MEKNVHFYEKYVIWIRFGGGELHIQTAALLLSVNKANKWRSYARHLFACLFALYMLRIVQNARKNFEWTIFAHINQRKKKQKKEGENGEA